MSFKDRINSVGTHLKNNASKYIPGALALVGAAIGVGAAEGLGKEQEYQKDSVQDLVKLNDQAADKGVDAIFKSTGTDKYLDTAHNFRHSTFFDGEDNLRKMQENPNFSDHRDTKQGYFDRVLNGINPETQKDLNNTRNGISDFLFDEHTPKEQVQYRNDGALNVNGIKINADHNLDNSRLDLAKDSIHDQYKSAAGDKLDPVTNRVLATKPFQDKMTEYGEDFKNAGFNSKRDGALQGLAAGGTIAAGLALRNKTLKNKG